MYTLSLRCGDTPTILTTLIHDHKIYFHFAVFSSISFTNNGEYGHLLPLLVNFSSVFFFFSYLRQGWVLITASGGLLLAWCQHWACVGLSLDICLRWFAVGVVSVAHTGLVLGGRLALFIVTQLTVAHC